MSEHNCQRTGTKVTKLRFFQNLISDIVHNGRKLLLHFALRKKKWTVSQLTDTYFQTNDVRMHAVELTSVLTENRAVVVVHIHSLDLVLAAPPHLNSDLA